VKRNMLTTTTGARIQMNPVMASIISSIGYDGETSSLYIQFKATGIIYQYNDVPVSVYDELLNSDGKGLYYNQYIRNKYACSIVGREKGIDNG
jgi:hypothetical protein